MSSPGIPGRVNTGCRAHGQTGDVELRSVGPRALLAEVADAGEALSLATWARAARGSAPTRSCPAPGPCSSTGSPTSSGPRALARWSPIRRGAAGRAGRDPRSHYDGADLEAVAERWGTDVAGVVARHTATDFVSAFCGFAPGFAYLAGLPATTSRVPRLDSPRSEVPAGAVGLAGSWCGIYPTASPGWLAADRAHRRRRSGTRPRRSPRCWPRAPGSGSSAA